MLIVQCPVHRVSFVISLVAPSLFTALKPVRLKKTERQSSASAGLVGIHWWHDIYTWAREMPITISATNLYVTRYCLQSLSTHFSLRVHVYRIYVVGTKIRNKQRTNISRNCFLPVWMIGHNFVFESSIFLKELEFVLQYPSGVQY